MVEEGREGRRGEGIGLKEHGRMEVKVKDRTRRRWIDREGIEEER